MSTKVIMADDVVCDVASNSEVFDDVDDHGSIMHNVVRSCSKILIPSMAQSSISKLTTAEDEEVVSTDGIFHHHQHQHEEDDDEEKSDEEDASASDPNTDDNLVNIKPELDEKIRRASVHSPRTVKWSLHTMAAAMDSVFGGELTTTNAARRYQIPRTTLLDRLSMKVKRQHLDSPGSFPLNIENDAKISEFVQENIELDKPTLIKGILHLGEQLAKEQGRPFDSPLNSRKWLKMFVQKHPNLNIFSYNRSRAATSSRSVSISGSTTSMRAPSLSSNDNTVLIPQQILHIHQDSLTPSLAHLAGSGEQSSEQLSPPPSLDTDNVFDSFESTLAKQGVRAIEEKLSAEQFSYFNYRFLNRNLNRGYELWRLCKSKMEGGDNLSTFALNGIEQGLIDEHLKYFRFRFDNDELEEGYKLWALLREKSHE